MRKSTLLLCILFSIYSIAQVPDVNLEEGYTVTNHGYILYPSPDAEYDHVIEVGPGHEYAEIHDIPVSLIVKNTLIKIHHRTDPYRTKVFVDVIATENEKVRFQGIPNSNGDLPIISFENAISWGNTINSVLETGSAFVVYGTWANKPAWIDIVNLHIKDAPYASIWAKGDHISIKGCFLENSANGVFFQAANQLLIEISTYMLIEGCKFSQNGTVNGWLHHNIYSQGMHALIQFNTIEKLKDNSFGASLKDRSSHTVIRYNKIQTTARTLDLVEPEDTDQVLTQDDNWDDVYVYGNLMTNKQVGVNMVHYGYDNTPTYRREGTLHFHNNTVVIDRTDDPWRVNLFDVNSTNSLVEFSNNIVTATGMQVFYMFRSNNTDNAGNINFGPSYFHMQGTQNNWGLNENSGTYLMSGEDNVIEGDNPGFVDYDNDDFTLVSDASVIGIGNDLLTSMGLSVEYNSISPMVNMLRTDQAEPSLGSFSSQATASSQDFSVETLSAKAYPNPFANQITIEYNLVEDSHCMIEIYNPLGQKIRTISNEHSASGIHSTLWDGKNDNGNNVAHGMYFYSIKTKKSKLTKAIILRKN